LYQMKSSVPKEKSFHSLNLNVLINFIKWVVYFYDYKQIVKMVFFTNLLIILKEILI
jgi:hypothetical protein